jgi:hypothetical protein
VAGAVRRVPAVNGEPISLRFQPELTVRKGKLLSGKKRGTAVHAGSFLRRRVIVLESELREKHRELSRILVHELFHFVWLRLSNSRRRSFEDVLQREMRRRARGELGWSAEWRKRALTPADASGRSRKWREYATESFCDSAAHLFSLSRQHPEYTLSGSFRKLRAQWFRSELPATLKV